MKLRSMEFRLTISQRTEDLFASWEKGHDDEAQPRFYEESHEDLAWVIVILSDWRGGVDPHGAGLLQRGGRFSSVSLERHSPFRSHGRSSKMTYGFRPVETYYLDASRFSFPKVSGYLLEKISVEIGTPCAQDR